MTHIKLEDGTTWPLPIIDFAYLDPTRAQLMHLVSVSEAYEALLYHPWGVRVSQQKIAMLRRALRERK